MNKSVQNELKEYRKKNYSTLEVVFLISFTALIFMFVGAFIFYKQYSKDVAYKKKSYLKDIDNVYSSLLKEYITDIDSNLLISSAISGMKSFLNDDYSLYLSPRESNINVDPLNGSYIGLGITVNETNNYLEVIDVSVNTPSYNKIHVGDVIYKVDNLSLDKYKLKDIKELLSKSKRGDNKRIYIIRNNKEIVLDIKLDEIMIKSVSSYVIEKHNKKIGVIKIDSFAKNTSFQFKKEIEKLNIDYLIIDLRNNTGGYISNASSIANLFLNKGDVIYRVKSKNGEELIKNQFAKKIDVKLVLLVNQNTASSAELLTSALKENLGIKVIGVKTYGKGYIQKVLELENGGLFKFSSREFLTSKGNIIEKKGIDVDFEVKEKIKNNIDIQLEKAIEEVLK